MKKWSLGENIYCNTGPVQKCAIGAIRCRYFSLPSRSGQISPVHAFLPRCIVCMRSFLWTSVCPSVKRVHCDKTKQISADIPYTIWKVNSSSRLRSPTGRSTRCAVSSAVMASTVTHKSQLIIARTLSSVHATYRAAYFHICNIVHMSANCTSTAVHHHHHRRRHRCSNKSFTT